jgi:hypothetical protein
MQFSKLGDLEINAPTEQETSQAGDRPVNNTPQFVACHFIVHRSYLSPPPPPTSTVSQFFA